MKPTDRKRPVFLQYKESAPRPSSAGSEAARVKVRGRHLVVFLSVLGVVALGSVSEGQTLGGGVVTSWVVASLALWALRGGVSSLQSLSLLWLVNYLNPALFAPSPDMAALRWFVIGGALIGTIKDTLVARRPIPRAVLIILAFGGIEIGVVLLGSHSVAVSLAKVMSVLAAIVAVFLAYAFCNSKELRDYRDWLAAMFLVVLVGSSPLVFAVQGYVEDGIGFQGILNHPQAYGVFLAPFVAWLLATAMFTRASDWRIVAVLVLAIVSLLLSQTRTAALALAAGFLVSAFLALWSRREWLREIWDGVYRRRLAYLAIGIAGVIWWVGADGSGSVSRWITKNRPTSSLIEAVTASRTSPAEESWKNFLENPITGIGFGLPSDLTPDPQPGSKIKGLPVALPVEKGFLPTGILEETGLLGAVAVFSFLIMIMRPIMRRAGIATMLMVLTALLTNLGEATFFSVGGMGLLVWLLVGYGYGESRAAALRPSAARAITMRQAGA